MPPTHRKLLTLLFTTAAAIAQTTGTITGTVTAVVDGGAVAKAAIQAKNAATGATFTAQSAATGSYTLAGLPAGTYELSASLPAMKPFNQPGVVVQGAQTSRINIRLEDVQINTLGESRADYSGANRRPPPSGTTPRSRDGKPDLSGVWYALQIVDGGKPELLPGAEAVWKERLENFARDSTHARCLPNGIGFTGMFGDFRLVQSPGVTVILHELGEDLPRIVLMDERGHPKDPDPTWYGHSIGKWDGDALVIDTVGFNGKTWLDPTGLPSTERLHSIERFRRPDFGHLELELTVDDPGAYTKPWTVKKVTTLAPAGEELMEYVCEENNRDLPHLVGK